MQIYLIRNRVNGKVYVGQTTNRLQRRWNGHKNAATRGNGAYLYQSMRKHGFDKFEVVPLFHAFSADYLDELERHFIALFQSSQGQFGYNATIGGMRQGTPTEAAIEKNRLAHLGKKMSQEAREKIRRAITGLRWSEEARARWKGHKKSEETKHKMSQSQAHRPRRRGYKISEETRQRMSIAAKIRESKLDRRGSNNPCFGKSPSEATRKKMSDAHRGRPSWNKGVTGWKLSEETKQKMRESQRARRTRERA